MKRLVLAAALAACAALSPAPSRAVTADGAMWNATSVGEVGYLPLEDLRSFYKLMPLPQPESGTRAIGNGETTLVFGPGARELKVNGIRFILSHPVKDVVTNSDLLISKQDMVKLVDPVLRPTYIANRRLVKSVVIDPGHGGHDAGTVTPYAREADVALIVANKLAEELRRRGFHAVLTHDANRYQSDQQRVDAAGEALNPIFISLHTNSGRSDISGVETYTVVPAEAEGKSLPGNENDAANIALALALHSSLVKQCGAKDGACRRMHYSLLSSLNCPAARVELGYATNPQEGALLSTDVYQSRMATALADGVERFAHLMNPDTVLQQTAASAPPAPEVPAEPVKVDAGKQQPPAADTNKNGKGKKPAGNTSRKTATKPQPASTKKPAGNTRRR